MYSLDERDVYCPYCNEPITLLIDPSVEEQNYVEDCQVCCQPMVVQVSIETDEKIAVSVSREDD